MTEDIYSPHESWYVEAYDPLAREWVHASSTYLNKEEACGRFEVRKMHHPDELFRLIVATTRYTVIDEHEPGCTCNGPAEKTDGASGQKHQRQCELTTETET